MATHLPPLLEENMISAFFPPSKNLIICVLFIPLQYSYLENPMDRGVWWATVLGVSESDTTDLTFTHYDKGDFFIAAAKSLQLCLTLCNPMDYTPPDSSVHGILQARTLEWVAISFSERNYRKKESEAT